MSQKWKGQVYLTDKNFLLYKFFFLASTRQINATVLLQEIFAQDLVYNLKKCYLS